MSTISWQDFDKVEMRVGRVQGAIDFPEAHNPSYLLEIDFGPEIGRRKSAAAIAEFYDKGDLEGRLVVAVTNFPPKQIANHMSEVLTLAAVNKDGTLKLLEPAGEVELGARIR
ncbi:MAG: tRNA-binding protein [Anaerolineales bacterium]